MLEWTEILLRLLLAAVFGAAVGIERERKDWAAGMRTHMMVCVGAALTMMVSAFGFTDILGTPNVELDPSRVAAQVISGIGFLGAGTILFLKPATIKGLTTASGLWTIAGIGLATGGGMYFAATAATAIALFILWGMQIVQEKYSLKGSTKSIHVSAGNRAVTANVLDILWKYPAMEITTFAVHNNDPGFTIDFSLANVSKKEIGIIISEIQSLNSVGEIAWS
ncbi:MAG TPA: MgtC/SapB family protein [Flavobacterium sp.]|nr:MgtC/SapB family protein [Flavobacterium sp.]